MKFSLRQIEIFAAIAREQNVSRAAEQLCLSQSAASNALVELERQFDCPLFDRIGKSLHLNASGRALLPMAEQLLDQAREIESCLGGGILVPLTVGATLTIGNYLGTLVIAEYMQQHPEAPVSLQVANTQTIVERLLRFDCDIGLIEGEVSHPDLLVEPWLEDELVVFCGPAHPLAAAGTADVATLAGQSWILREQGSGTRRQFDRGVAPMLGRYTLRLELEHTEAIKRAVESNLGIGCLSRLALREAFRRGSLVEIRTPELDLSRYFYRVRHARRHESRAVQTFCAVCDRICGEARRTADLVLPFIP
ncbi:LysR family transcriptional regulator [Dechloromonas sp. ARDL1]|uniref:LysR family transcriptional regulator n=1 Tax=Dechloromonas sp. ARDL1 TaxID=3322121 RepID=UPI003DA7A557